MFKSLSVVKSSFKFKNQKKELLLHFNRIYSLRFTVKKRKIIK